MLVGADSSAIFRAPSKTIPAPCSLSEPPMAPGVRALVKMAIAGTRLKMEPAAVSCRLFAVQGKCLIPTPSSPIAIPLHCSWRTITEGLPHSLTPYFQPPLPNPAPSYAHSFLFPALCPASLPRNATRAHSTLSDAGGGDGFMGATLGLGTYDVTPGLEARDLRLPREGRGFELCIYV